MASVSERKYQPPKGDKRLSQRPSQRPSWSRAHKSPHNPPPVVQCQNDLIHFPNALNTVSKPDDTRSVMNVHKSFKEMTSCVDTTTTETPSSLETLPAGWVQLTGRTAQQQQQQVPTTETQLSRREKEEYDATMFIKRLLVNYRKYHRALHLDPYNNIEQTVFAPIEDDDMDANDDEMMFDEDVDGTDSDTENFVEQYYKTDRAWV